MRNTIVGMLVAMATSMASAASDLAWIDVTPDGLVLRELAPGVTFEQVQALTEPRLTTAPDVKTMEI